MSDSLRLHYNYYQDYNSCPFVSFTEFYSKEFKKYVKAQGG